jgi:hypothetical protein
MRVRIVLAASALLLCCAAALSAPEPSKHAATGASYGSLPMAFEPNVGQTDPSVSFLARGSG